MIKIEIQDARIVNSILHEYSTLQSSVQLYYEFRSFMSKCNLLILKLVLISNIVSRKLTIYLIFPRKKYAVVLK